MSTAADVGAVALPVVTGAGLLFVWQQIRSARQVARSQFLLDLDRRLRDHGVVAFDVRSAAWKPKDEAEGFDLARYMGLIERIAILVDDGILDLSTTRKLYGWRMRWLIANECVRQDLDDRPDGWRTFIDLWRKLDEQCRREIGEALCPGHPAPGNRATTSPRLPHWAADEAYLMTLVHWRRARRRPNRR
jgi:hypothetical protein